MQTGLPHTVSNPECCVKPGGMLLDYSLSSHCVCYCGPSYTIAHCDDGFGVGVQDEEKPWQQRCPCLCIKQLYLSKKENITVEKIIHNCTVHIELSELRLWKHLPSSHIGQPLKQRNGVSGWLGKLNNFTDLFFFFLQRREAKSVHLW